MTTIRNSQLGVVTAGAGGDNIRVSQLGIVAIMAPPVAAGMRASQLAIVSVIANGQSFQPLEPVIGLGCWSPCNNHMFQE